MKTCAFALERTGSINSNWVWGEELLAHALFQKLKRYFKCSLLDWNDCRQFENSKHFDYAIYFHGHLPKRIGKKNLIWLHNARESFSKALTNEQWIENLNSEIKSSFDGAMSASVSLIERMRQLGLLVHPFPLFADVRLFRPKVVKNFLYDVVYVSNNIKGENVNREFIYPVVEFCHREGLRFAIFGAGWDKASEWGSLQALWKGVLHPRHLPSVYSSSRVVLSVHFPSHREFGILTSRVYEALACGGIVVSDWVSDAEDEFGDVVFFAEGTKDFVALLARAIQMEDHERKFRSRAGRSAVAKFHSSSVRARKLRGILQSLDEGYGQSFQYVDLREVKQNYISG